MRSVIKGFLFVLLLSLFSCNGVEEVIIDDDAPVAPTNLSWSQTSPVAETTSTVTAEWTVSTSADIDTQTITFYKDSSCSSAWGVSATILFSQNTYIISVTPSESYYYTIRSTDIDGNSSTSSCSDEMKVLGVDVVAPEAATNISWVETSPHDTLNITAQWTLSVAADLTTQRIEYYTDAACTVAEGTSVVLDNVTTTHNFIGVHLNDYYFQVVSLDEASNETASACSSLMHVDTADVTPPVSAVVLGWAQFSPHNTTAVNAVWNKSTSADVASQTITFYTDATCTTAEGTTAVLGASDAQYNFTGVDLQTYYYTINTFDIAGNNTLSACSQEMEIAAGGDTTPPAPATSLGWATSSPTNGTLQPTWTPSISSDLGSQRVNYYTDAACSIPYVTGSLLSSVDTTETTEPGVNGLTFYYTITSTDGPGNSSVSACSTTGMTVDTTAPVSATSLGWVQVSPSSTAAVDSSWTVSVSADVSSQEIHYYTDPTCTTLDSNVIVGAAITTNSFTGVDTQSYYYTVTTYDLAGNLSVSACSSEMNISL